MRAVLALGIIAGAGLLFWYAEFPASFYPRILRKPYPGATNPTTTLGATA